jgi:protoporphyrinogen IX oxidase
MSFSVLKALHLIFMVTWFAGLFYMVRLMIYHVEANDRTSAEKQILQNQYAIMMRRLWYGITWPSLVLVLIFGIWMLVDGFFNPFVLNYLKMSFMHLKLSLIFLLVIYHLVTGRYYKQIKEAAFKRNSLQLRLWNEVATLFLVSIIFVVVLKNQLNWLWGGLGLFIFAATIYGIVLFYKKRRENAEKRD